MECRYMRIQGREDSWITKYPKGIFGMCWRLIMEGVMEPEDEKTWVFSSSGEVVSAFFTLCSRSARPGPW